VKELTNIELFEDHKTIAWELIAQYEYPYDVLPHIGEFIVRLGESLPADRFERRGDDK